jgi:peptide-methionine (R)-S-oxide reductase
MKRRQFITTIATTAATVGGVTMFKNVFGQRTAEPSGPITPEAEKIKTALQQANGTKPVIVKLTLTADEWKKRLTPAQFNVLRDEGTERPGTSVHNNEKRKGVFHCAGCDLALFTSEMKYESGTGWPSFYTTLPGVFEKSTDYKMIYPRTEYHCAKCGGHHGHVFKDGPQPTRERWCNNGVALVFKAAV